MTFRLHKFKNTINIKLKNIFIFLVLIIIFYLLERIIVQIIKFSVINEYKYPTKDS
jgi:hypothetical protein